ncbi:MAG: carbohydrate ABC transporter permease [Anaerolineales bacterium]|jgi:multiple sugar transport system permease protein
MVRRRKRTTVIISSFLILFSVLYILPYVWMTSMSFKPDEEIFTRYIFPKNPTLEQYQRLLFGYEFQGRKLEVQFPTYFKNTAIITTVSLLLIVFTDSLAAYAFAKLNFKGKRVLFWVMIGTMMLPIYATLIPTFWLFSKLKMVNTYQSLILPGVIDAYGIFLLKQYMETIPDELLDAATVDGAGVFRRFWSVVMPLSRPAIGTLAVFRFLMVWNDYLWPLVIIRKEDMYTLTIGIANMQMRQGMVVWGSQMAASVLATIPVIIMVLAMQRQFLRGLTAGAFKA